MQRSNPLVLCSHLPNCAHALLKLLGSKNQSQFKINFFQKTKSKWVEI